MEKEQPDLANAMVWIPDSKTRSGRGTVDTFGPRSVPRSVLPRSRPEIIVRSGNKVGKYFRFNLASHVGA